MANKANEKEVVNQGIGNRCEICGACFDEGGICNGGHEQGRTYLVQADNPSVTRPKE